MLAGRSQRDITVIYTHTQTHTPALLSSAPDSTQNAFDVVSTSYLVVHWTKGYRNMLPCISASFSLSHLSETLSLYISSHCWASSIQPLSYATIGWRWCHLFRRAPQQSVPLAGSVNGGGVLRSHFHSCAAGEGHLLAGGPWPHS